MIISGAVLTWTGLLLTNTASQIRSQATFVSKLRSLLDCPVPRLTLLFFGAAKGCSGSSKNGHRRDSLPTFGRASQRPNWALLSSHATAPEEVHYQRNNRYD